MDGVAFACERSRPRSAAWRHHHRRRSGTDTQYSMITFCSRLLCLLLLAVLNDYCCSTADYGFVPHPCLLRCKDNHMLEMSSEWSPDFFLPIISVLKDSKNTTAAYALTEDICNHNRRLEFCLLGCASSSKKTILLAGLLPWKHICDVELDTMRSLLPCWAIHASALNVACNAATSHLALALNELAMHSDERGNDTERLFQNRIGAICTAMNNFFACSMTEHKARCGSISANFVLNVSKVTTNSIMAMLRNSAIGDRMPNTCSEWKQIRETEPAHKKLRRIGLAKTAHCVTPSPTVVLLCAIVTSALANVLRQNRCFRATTLTTM